ncbi:MAG: hypothetical protein K2Y40_02445 [Reyranella sp.]|nr:hypothetical protein [Reyranella sp.]
MTDFDDATWAFLENEKLEQTRDYLRRGRPYAGLAPAELEPRWVAAFRDFAADVGDDDDLVRMFDLEAEYRLRGLRLPEELVAAEQEALDRGMTDWLAEDPDSWDDMADQVMDEIAAFTVDAATASKS